LGSVASVLPPDVSAKLLLVANLLVFALLFLLLVNLVGQTCKFWCVIVFVVVGIIAVV